MGSNAFNKIKVFSLGILAALLLAEAGLRTGELCCRNNKGLQSGAHAEDTFVILCVGDSFVYGLGAPKGKSFPRQLEEMLNSAHLPKRVKVINAGMPNNNLVQVYEQLDRDIGRVRPDLVVVLGGMISNINLYGFHTFMEEPSALEKIRHQLGSIRLCGAAARIARAVKERGRIGKDKKNAPPAPKSEAVRRAEEYCAEGLRHVDAGDYKKAIACFEQSVALMPEMNLAYRFLGDVYKLYGRYDDAARCYEQYLKMPLDFTMPYFELGLFYWQQLKDAAKAFAAFKRGVERDPGGVNYSYSGLILLHDDPLGAPLRQEIERFLNGMKEKANEDYRQAIASVSNSDTSFDHSVAQWQAESLDAIVALCRKWGSAVILQDYPETSMNGLYEDVAAKNGVPFVRQSAAFAALLQHTPRDFLFSTDANHCNEQGYRVMAQNIRDKILQLGIVTQSAKGGSSRE